MFCVRSDIVNNPAQNIVDMKRPKRSTVFCLFGFKTLIVSQDPIMICTHWLSGWGEGTIKKSCIVMQHEPTVHNKLHPIYVTYPIKPGHKLKRPSFKNLNEHFQTKKACHNNSWPLRDKAGIKVSMDRFLHFLTVLKHFLDIPSSFNDSQNISDLVLHLVIEGVHCMGNNYGRLELLVLLKWYLALIHLPSRLDTALLSKFLEFRGPGLKL